MARGTVWHGEQIIIIYCKKYLSWFKGTYKMIDYNHLQSLDWKYELQCRSDNEMFMRILEILIHP